LGGAFFAGIRVAAGWLAVLAAGSGWLSAGQIAWTLVAVPGNQLSSGAALPDGYAFQLGAFEHGFMPSTANTAEWPAHWRGLAAAVYDPTHGGLGANFFVDQNSEPFPAGKQLHVLGYRASGSGIAEVWLATDAGWRMASDDPLETPVFVDLAVADSVVAGQADADEAWIRTARVAMAEAPPLYYAQWQLSWFDAAERANAAISGLWADPDGDGLGNALEYFTGGNPRLPGLQPLRIEAVGAQLLLSCRFDASARVNWVLRCANDPGQWSAAPVQPVPNAAGDQLQLMVTPGGAKEFWRMAVSAVVP
jgi:hypothetical protein